MRRLLMVVGGVLLVALGILWLLQGLNVIKGSGMSGTRAWAYIGPLVAIGGLAMIVSGVRGRAARQGPPAPACGGYRRWRWYSRLAV